jgi:transcriptional regulator with XRE-family HTH domain
LPYDVKDEIVRRMPNIQVQFGKAVRRLRERRDLSQEKLAELAGLHATYIGRIERGRQNISLANIGKIARALKVKPRELFKGVH